jgi:hypothetical protein
MLRTNTLVSSEGFSLLTLINLQFEMPFQDKKMESYDSLNLLHASH